MFWSPHLHKWGAQKWPVNVYHFNNIEFPLVLPKQRYETEILEKLWQKRKKAWNSERRSVLIKRKMGLMYERMCFQRGKGNAMAAGSDTVLVLLLCQYLLWLSSTFPPSWLMLPSQPKPTSLKTEKSKLWWSTSHFYSVLLSFSLVLVLIAWDKQFWGMVVELGHDGTLTGQDAL